MGLFGTSNGTLMNTMQNNQQASVQDNEQSVDTTREPCRGLFSVSW